MTNRKKKLRIYQSIFLIVGILIVLFTYSKNNNSNQEKIISKSLQKKLRNNYKIETQKTEIHFLM